MVALGGINHAYASEFTYRDLMAEGYSVSAATIEAEELQILVSRGEFSYFCVVPIPPMGRLEVDLPEEYAGACSWLSGGADFEYDETTEEFAPVQK